MSNRLRDSGSPSSSGLIKAALQTGRQRGDAATPQPPFASPIPNRPYRQQMTSIGSGNNLRSAFSHHPTSSQSSLQPHTANTNTQQGYGHRPDGSYLHSSSLYDREGETQPPYRTLPGLNRGSYGSESSGNEGAPLHVRGDSPSTRKSSESSTGYDSVDMSSAVTMRFGGHSQYMQNQAFANLQTTNVTHLSTRLQERIVILQEKIKRFPASHMSQVARREVLDELRAMGQFFNEEQRLVQQRLDKAEAQNESFKKDLEKAFSRIDDLEGRLKEATSHRELVVQRGCHHDGGTDQTTTEQRWQFEREEFLRKIREQKEMIDGKRALWLEANPEPSPRRDMMKALRAEGGSFGSDLVATIPPSSHTSFKSSYGSPPQMKRLPTGPSTPSLSFSESFKTENAASRPRLTQNTLARSAAGTSSRPRAEAGEIAPYRFPTDQEPEIGPVATYWQGEFGKLFGLIEGWSLTYCAVPNVSKDRAIASSLERAWNHMINCTYPGRPQEAHNHILALLGDYDGRRWFIMRLFVQYCAEEILSIRAFMGYSRNVARTIQHVAEKLKERGLANEARQKLVDMQTQAVESIKQDENFDRYRSSELERHTRNIRDLLSALLDDNSNMQQAAFDIGHIVLSSWDLSIKMHASRLQFPQTFPKTAEKFVAATMIAKDRTTENPMSIQIQQVRVKLVITPVITMRDDKGTTIIVKTLHKATVLLMN